MGSPVGGRARQKGVALRMALPESIAIQSDYRKLYQIGLNLLGNALKYTQSGEVWLEAVLNGDRLLLTVGDTGPGIAPADLGQIFSGFYRSPAVAQVEGTGLGLTLTRKLTRLLGGDLAVLSEKDCGSIFAVNLPYLPSIDLPPSFVPTVRQRLAPNHPAQRLLVVDDNLDNLNVLAQTLKSIGFAVEAAQTGAAAIALAQTWRPHLVLLDWNMPDLSGPEIAAQIEGVPMVCVTADVFAQPGPPFCDRLLKPWSLSNLLTTLARHLDVTYVSDASMAEATVAETKPSAPSLDGLAAMPSPWRQALTQAAVLGSDRQVLALLNDIPEEYRSLRDTLANLARAYQFPQILASLGQLSA
ncbi:MAG: response regulator [Oscillatoriales cyanobacterium SM2_1_8]|nr:response regulator [Oscillatoriales cyanobacterium SM2_1_8]